MKLTQLYILLFSIIILAGCQKKEIHIPATDIVGIQEVPNFSEVWMFMKINEKDTILQLNDKNLIGSTNWIFNIDKHLKLEKVMPKIQYFQEKRLKKSMHNTDGFSNYLSYSDTISKILSFVDISHIQFHFDTIQSKKIILKNLDYYKNYNNFHLSFGLNTYYLNENKIDKVEFFDTLMEFINFTENGQKTLLHLNFNQNLTYQEYLNIKTHLLLLQKEQFIIDKNEYIFDADKIPECGCDS
ncbi:MAG: hypothetical protein Q8J84_06590 [Flavobacteriaceae bacterium]|nr:hypothetical protein [Flavobacteriaceae bacterium]